jgi:hypothetical protein
MWFGSAEGWCTRIEGWRVGCNPPFAVHGVYTEESKYFHMLAVPPCAREEEECRLEKEQQFSMGISKRGKPHIA